MACGSELDVKTAEEADVQRNAVISTYGNSNGSVPSEDYQQPLSFTSDQAGNYDPYLRRDEGQLGESEKTGDDQCYAEDTPIYVNTADLNAGDNDAGDDAHNKG